MDRKQAELEAAVRTKVIDNRLSCAQAHDIAAGLNVSLQEVGQKAEELGIKITKCQLGCF